MSNNQMVSVPREAAEALAQLNAGNFPAQENALLLLRELLTQPAEQHQGEPVAEVEIGFNRFNDTGEGLFVKWLLPDGAPLPEGTKLYTRSAQGEPVWYMTENGQSAMTAKLKSVGEKNGWDTSDHRIPLYTHADPADVGEIKKHIAELLGEVDTLTAEVERLRAELVEWKERCGGNNREAMTWMRKHDALRTNLAERNALLQYIDDQMTNLQPHIVQACYPGKSAFIDTYVDPVIDRIRALSASAEPRLTVNGPTLMPEGGALFTFASKPAAFEVGEDLIFVGPGGPNEIVDEFVGKVVKVVGHDRFYDPDQPLVIFRAPGGPGWYKYHATGAQWLKRIDPARAALERKP